MILLTDGIPNRTPRGGTNLSSLKEEAHRIRLLGIKIIAIGVGENVDFKLLADITCDENFVYSKHNFHELKNSIFISKLTSSICTDPVLKTSVLPRGRTLPNTAAVEVTTSTATTKPTPASSAVTTPSATSKRPSGPPTGPTVDPDTGLCRCNNLEEIAFPALSLSVFDINQYPGIGSVKFEKFIS